MNNVTPIKPSESDNSDILMFFHCAKCLEEKPDSMSAREWSQIEVGWTTPGVQVWCRRHNCNIMHVDFEGQTHKTI